MEQYVDCLRIYFERHDSDELVELLFELAFEGKDDGFFAAVQHLMKLFPGQILVYGPILMSLLRHVERDYERQDLTIADEHRISQLIRDACILCYFDLPSPAKSLCFMLISHPLLMWLQREQEQAEMIQAAEAAEADQVHLYRDPPL